MIDLVLPDRGRQTNIGSRASFPNLRAPPIQIQVTSVCKTVSASPAPPSALALRGCDVSIVSGIWVEPPFQKRKCGEECVQYKERFANLKVTRAEVVESR